MNLPLKQRSILDLSITSTTTGYRVTCPNPPLDLFGAHFQVHSTTETGRTHKEVLEHFLSSIHISPFSSAQNLLLLPSFGSSNLSNFVHPI
jgi:hypothetical protein